MYTEIEHNARTVAITLHVNYNWYNLFQSCLSNLKSIKKLITNQLIMYARYFIDWNQLVNTEFWCLRHALVWFEIDVWIRSMEEEKEKIFILLTFIFILFKEIRSTYKIKKAMYRSVSAWFPLSQVEPLDRLWLATKQYVIVLTNKKQPIRYYLKTIQRSIPIRKRSYQAYQSENIFW